MLIRSMSTIGISNFTTGDQVRRVKALLGRIDLAGAGRMLRVGVKFNDEAAMGSPPRGIVTPETLPLIFCDDTVVNCLHFSFMANSPYLAKHLSTAIGYAGMNIDSVQIDADWPDPGAVLDGVHRSRKTIKTILRIRGSALDAAGNDPAEVVRMLADYTEVIQGVQFHATYDPHNTAEAMGMIPFVAAVREHYPDLGIGISSHECAGIIDRLGSLVKLVPDISIDSRIELERDSNVERYLTRACGLFAAA